MEHFLRIFKMAAPTQTMYLCVLVLYTICLIFIFSPVVLSKPKAVSLMLNAKWNSTPVLLEVSEFLASENNGLFWEFVDDIRLVDAEKLYAGTDEQHYRGVLQYAGRHLSPLQHQLLQLSLSLRYYSPTIEMYNQIAKDIGPLDGCKAFVDVHGEKTCEPEKITKLVATAKERPKPQVYKFEHTFPRSANRDVIIILYAELGRLSFKRLHNSILELVDKGGITYILRHYTPNLPDKRVRLSGYGVELAIKSTEYKAKDDTKVKDEKKDSDDDADVEDEASGFIFSKLTELNPDLKGELKEFKHHIVDSATELVPMKVWQYQDLSLQGAQKVLDAKPDDALKVLRDISQNFPTMAKSLIRIAVKETVKAEIVQNQKYFENQHHIGQGDTLFYLNGLPIDLDVYDIFTMVELLKSEGRLMEGMFSLGIQGEQMMRLLKLDFSTEEDYALDMRHSAVHFINNLEKDLKYRSWGRSVRELLQPTFPGMLRHIARNMFNLVLIVDPVDLTSRELIKLAEAFYVHSAPVRVGFVFVVNNEDDVTGRDDPGVALTRAFSYILKNAKPDQALSFITDVYTKTTGEDLTASDVITEFKSSYPKADIDVVFGGNSDYDDVRQGGDLFIEQSGLSGFPQVLLNGAPMKKAFLTDETFEEGIVTELLQATKVLQLAVYNDELSDDDDVFDWEMDKDNVLPRLNSKILTPSGSALDLTMNVDPQIASDADLFSALTAADMTSVVSAHLKYLTKKDEAPILPVSIWTVCDPETVQGRELLYAAIKHLKTSTDARLSVIFNAVSLTSDNYLSKAIHIALNDLNNNMAKSFITKLVKEENVRDIRSGAKKLDDLGVYGMDMKSYLAALEKVTPTFLTIHQTFAQKALSFTPGQRGVIANGQIIGPFSDDELFIQEDFHLLDKYTSKSSGKKVMSQVTRLGKTGESGSDLVMKVSALLTATTRTDKRQELHFHGDRHSVIKIDADPALPAYEIDVVLDPASRESQKLSGILLVLKQVFNVKIRVFFNCREKLSELPVKSFYRYVLDPEMMFKPDGSFMSGPSARFMDMPQKSLLTMNMNPPESWLVESVQSLYDLDNILLEEVERSVTAEFELEYLLLEGHCFDSGTGQPPRGLQFILGTNSTPAVMDTIVMANLGYFQLKAKPGAWILSLRDGRSKDIYDIVSHEFTDTPSGATDVVVTLNSFKSKIIKVKVSKKPGMQKEDLLKDEEERKEGGGGIWDSISSSFSGGGTNGVDEKDNTLNIFSVASGHLYERFLRIMMLSVLKQTKSKVKFWFLKNYLSPTFKDFIPHMAEHYKFEYELVQYKWPRWLQQQTEKQRIIWGYKILFLDVLFPLDVKKIIFVDADQMVRTDLQELHDLDLGGAPYGYTPFCESRKEMDGFRFWKSGYWSSHLGHRKYHISALYVIDLKRFRRIAAGDRLRGQYQGLSQDPNSLSNLDQDLPNNMIHQVNIKSLPQEWLWCETWCSTEEKAKAKTIDLCNNPLTKEPKLQAAIRILPEWKYFDYEIKQLWDDVYGTITTEDLEYEAPVKGSETSIKAPKKDEF